MRRVRCKIARAAILAVVVDMVEVTEVVTEAEAAVETAAVAAGKPFGLFASSL